MLSQVTPLHRARMKQPALEHVPASIPPEQFWDRFIKVLLSSCPSPPVRTAHLTGVFLNVPRHAHLVLSKEPSTMTSLNLSLLGCVHTSGPLAAPWPILRSSSLTSEFPSAAADRSRLS